MSIEHTEANTASAGRSPAHAALYAAPFTVEGVRMSEKLSAEKLHQLAAATPMARLGRPEDIARGIALLASEASGFTTGHYLSVHGGGGAKD